MNFIDVPSLHFPTCSSWAFCMQICECGAPCFLPWTLLMSSLHFLTCSSSCAFCMQICESGSSCCRELHWCPTLSIPSLLSHVHSACRFGNLLLLLSCCCQLHCGSQLVISYLVFSCGLLQHLVLLHTNRGQIINTQKLICKARSRSIARNLRSHKESGFA